jgi:hypothetical protein
MPTHTSLCSLRIPFHFIYQLLKNPFLSHFFLKAKRVAGRGGGSQKSPVFVRYDTQRNWCMGKLAPPYTTPTLQKRTWESSLAIDVGSLKAKETKKRLLNLQHKWGQFMKRPNRPRPISLLPITKKCPHSSQLAKLNCISWRWWHFFVSLAFRVAIL